MGWLHLTIKLTNLTKEFLCANLFLVFQQIKKKTEWF